MVREIFWKMKNFPGQGKLIDLNGGKFRKNEKSLGIQNLPKIVTKIVYSRRPYNQPTYLPTQCFTKTWINISNVLNYFL